MGDFNKLPVNKYVIMVHRGYCETETGGGWGGGDDKCSHAIAQQHLWLLLHFLQISEEYTTGTRHLDITKSIAEHVIHTSCDKVGCLVGRYASCQRSTDTSRVNDRCELHFPLAVDVMAAVWPAKTN